MYGSKSARLRQLASELDVEDRKHRDQVSSLEREIRTLRVSKAGLEDDVSQLKESVQTKDNEISSLKRDLSERENKENEKENALREITLETIALKFQLASLHRKLKKLESNSPLQERNGSTIETEIEKESVKRLFDFGTLKGNQESDLDDDLMHEDDFVGAAKRGLSGVVRTVLRVEQSKSRVDKLKEKLGQALVELCAHGPGVLETVKVLLEHGADVNSARSEEEGGRTALHLAAAKGCKEIVEALLNTPGVDIDKVDARGRTALHLAARLRKAEAAKALLSKGADPDIETPEGHSAEKLATTNDASATFSLSFSPLSIKQVFESPSIKFWNRSALALRRYKQERWSEALEHFSSAVQITGQHPKVVNKMNLARLRFNRAKVALKLGEVMIALEDCNEAISLDPDYVNAYEIRSECHWSLFDFEHAVTDFETLQRLVGKTDASKAAEWKKRASEAKRCRDASHYDVLGVEKKASSADIKRAFRTESIKWHPDKHSKSDEDMHRARKQFQRINEAKEILLNANKRIIYDATMGYSSARGYFYDDLSDFDDDEDEEAYYTGASKKKNSKEFPWNDKTLSTPLHESKHSFQERKKQLEKDRIEKEEAETQRAKEVELEAKKMVAERVRAARESSKEETDQSNGITENQQNNKTTFTDTTEQQHSAPTPDVQDTPQVEEEDKESHESEQEDEEESEQDEDDEDDEEEESEDSGYADEAFKSRYGIYMDEEDEEEELSEDEFESGFFGGGRYYGSESEDEYDEDLEFEREMQNRIAMEAMANAFMSYMYQRELSEDEEEEDYDDEVSGADGEEVPDGHHVDEEESGGQAHKEEDANSGNQPKPDSAPSPLKQSTGAGLFNPDGKTFSPGVSSPKAHNQKRRNRRRGKKKR